MYSTEKGVTFLRRILSGESHFYVEKWPENQYSTGITCLHYTDPSGVWTHNLQHAKGEYYHYVLSFFIIFNTLRSVFIDNEKHNIVFIDNEDLPVMGCFFYRVVYGKPFYYLFEKQNLM
jgi:hypothetical protein